MPSTSELNEAIEAHDAERVKALITAGADVNADDELWFKPIQNAISCGASSAIVKLLLEAGASIKSSNSDPLIDAVAARNAEVVRLLLEHGADAQMPDGEEESETPLHLAVYGNDLACVEILLQHGADPLEPNGEGETPLDAARDQGLRSVLARLEAEL